MKHLKTGTLKHNPEAIKNCFRVKGNSTIATDDLLILFPERYVNKELAILEESVKVVGIYAIIDSQGNYASNITPIYQDIEVAMIDDVMCDDGRVYKELTIEKDSVFIANNDLIVSDNLIGDIYDELLIKGNVPWYLGYDILPRVFSETRKYCGNRIGDDRMVFEILTSAIARGEDKTEYYRHSKNVGVGKVNWLPLNNIYYYKNTGAKLVGAYYGYGVSSAIINKESASTSLEQSLLEGS